MENPDKAVQILDASLKVFAHYGYKKASMEEIAAGVDMTKGALYFYYRDKHDLYEKTIEHALLRWQSRVREAIAAESDIIQKFLVLAQKSYDYLAQDDDLRSLIIQDPKIQAITPSEDRYPNIGRVSYFLLREIIQQGVNEKKFRELNVDQVAGFLYSVYSTFIVKTYINAEGQSAQDMYQAGIDVILNGLRR